MGANHVIDFTETDLDEAIADLTERRGVDVVFESIGEKTYEWAVRSLVYSGRLVTIGALAPMRTAGYSSTCSRNSSIGVTGATISEFEDMLDVFFVDQVHPVIDNVISLEEIHVHE